MSDNTSDIVERLRGANRDDVWSIVDEAADEIERLRKALEPFAAIYEYFAIKGTLRPQTGNIYEWEGHRIGPRTLTVEHLRAASEVLGLTPVNPVP